jgi:hypothetical protein
MLRQLAVAAPCLGPMDLVAGFRDGYAHPRTCGGGLLDAAGRAVRGVAIGVVGTALLEGVLAWIGFAIAGVPHAGALAVVAFLLALSKSDRFWSGCRLQSGWASTAR